MIAPCRAAGRLGGLDEARQVPERNRVRPREALLHLFGSQRRFLPVRIVVARLVVGQQHPHVVECPIAVPEHGLLCIDASEERICVAVEEYRYVVEIDALFAHAQRMNDRLARRVGLA